LFLACFASTRAENKVFFNGFKPEVSGYPGQFKIVYAGSIIFDDQVFVTPHLEIKSFFLKNHPVSISLPRGGYMQDDDQGLYAIGRLYLELIMPRSWPEEYAADELTKWRAENDPLKLNQFILQKEMVSIEGKGTAYLDENLQPITEISATIKGAMAFIKWLKEKDMIENKQAMVSGLLLSGLTKENHETGQKYIDVNIRIENRTVFLGPLQLVSLPEIHWDKRILPGRHQ
jgi:hypothetical protein